MPLDAHLDGADWCSRTPHVRGGVNDESKTLGPHVPAGSFRDVGGLFLRRMGFGSQSLRYGNVKMEIVNKVK